ncbi:MAG: tetratricopeptide repeat protein, partial [Rhodopila sp.]
MAGRVLKVMVSSTFRDLKAEREAARDAILGQKMLPLMMETDSAIPDRGLLTNSFKMVDDADIYVVLISNYRYGQIIPEPDLNPKNLSITELEFERAASAKKQICAYLMDDSVPPPSVAAVLAEAATKDQLDAFRERARHPGRIAVDFSNIHDLKQKITQTLADLRHSHVREPPAPLDTTPILPPTRCFGRDPDAAPLIDALAAPAPVALLVLGGAGMGKTTLTRHVATAAPVIARFGPRRWFVPLETVTDAAALRPAVIQAIGLDPASTNLQAALSHLAEAPTLLVLDNLETPWEEDRRAVQDILQAIATTPNVSILVSLRGRAPPPAPRWTLPPAPLPQLPQDAARRLFLELAPTAAAHPAYLDRFLTALAGIPLAVELVALRAAGDTPLPELWGEWQRRGSALAADPDLPPDRRTSLHRSLDLSWNSPRLRQEGRRLFALLGQLPAGIAEPDRAALMRDDGTEAARQLRATGLAHNQGDRLDLLPPIRDYASTLYPPEAADAIACARHYLSLAKDHGARVGFEGGSEALIRLAPELPNVEASVHLAIDSGDLTPAVAAVNGLTTIIRFSGLGSAAAMDALRAACHATDDTAAEANCIYSLGDIALNRCIYSLGDIALNRSDHDTARARFEEALPLYRRVGDVLGEANCIKSLGDIALARSDHDTARARYEEALPLYRRVGAVLGEANCIQRLGDIALARSDHDTARARFEEALPLYRRVGHVGGEANCIKGLGDIALA